MHAVEYSIRQQVEANEYADPYGPIIGLSAVVTTAEGEEMVGTVTRGAGVGVVVTFPDGRWYRTGDVVRLVQDAPTSVDASVERGTARASRYGTMAWLAWRYGVSQGWEDAYRAAKYGRGESEARAIARKSRIEGYGPEQRIHFRDGMLEGLNRFQRGLTRDGVRES